MRWLSLVIVMAMASTAWARMPARRPQPSILSKCRTEKSWDAVTACIEKFGTPKQIRSSATMRLVEVTDASGAHLGLYLYVATATGWNLGGMHRGDEEMLAFEPFTIGNHSGYRFAFGIISPTTIDLEDSTTVSAMSSIKTEVYCSGDSYACNEVTTACDILVQGKAYRTFRGTVTFPNATEVKVVGDRTKAGSCAPPEHMSFSWPQG